MNEWFDKNTAIKYLKSQKFFITALDSHKAHNRRIDEMIKYLDEIPAVKFADKETGKWEIDCDGYYPYCSVCRKEPPGREMTEFCPRCGARMDGDINA